MLDRTAARSLWTWAREFEHEVLSSWRKEFHASEELTDALAVHMREVETTVIRRNGRGAMITVAIITHRPLECSAEVLDLQRTLHGGYEFVESSLPLK